MTDTFHIVTVMTTIGGKRNTTVHKFDTDKQAKEAFEKECFAFKSSGGWHIDPDECNDVIFIGTKTFPNRRTADVVTICISEEINIEYYVQKIERACGVDGGCRIVGQEPQRTKDIRKILRSLYKRGYDECFGRYEALY